MRTIAKFAIGFLLIVVILIVAIVIILPNIIKGYDFIDDPTCSPPCMANMTPGVTTESEALKIASAITKYGTCELIDQTKQGGIKYILCRSYKSYLTISFVNNLVDGFGIRPYPEISTHTIFDKFGYPDRVSCGYVNLPDYPPQVKLILWFDKYYLNVNFPEISGNAYDISANTKIDTVGYGSSESYKDSLDAARNMNSLQPWIGYMIYQCK